MKHEEMGWDGINTVNRSYVQVGAVMELSGVYACAGGMYTGYLWIVSGVPTDKYEVTMDKSEVPKGKLEMGEARCPLTIMP